jgi:5-methylcytosine-specific restriction protein A
VPNRLPTIGRRPVAKQPDTRPSPSKRGYGRNWQRCRLVKLAADPLCEDHKERGEVVEATEVDHVDGDTSNLADDNLRSLCKSCHSRKTVREQGALGHAKPKGAGGEGAIRPVER